MAYSTTMVYINILTVSGYLPGLLFLYSIEVRSLLVFYRYLGSLSFLESLLTVSQLDNHYSNVMTKHNRSAVKSVIAYKAWLFLLPASYISIYST